MANVREGVANVREGVANEREGVANVREGVANVREGVANEREEKGRESAIHSVLIEANQEELAVAYRLREHNIPAVLVALQTNGDLVLQLVAALLQKQKKTSHNQLVTEPSCKGLRNPHLQQQEVESLPQNGGHLLQCRQKVLKRLLQSRQPVSCGTDSTRSLSFPHTPTNTLSNLYAAGLQWWPPSASAPPVHNLPLCDIAHPAG